MEKNFEMYKTVEERGAAFERFCGENKCKSCVLNSGKFYSCVFAWLELEADEDKLMSCPYCGSKDVSIRESINNFWFVECKVRTAKSAQNVTKENAIVTYNRVAKAAMDAKKEVSNG